MIQSFQLIFHQYAALEMSHSGRTCTSCKKCQEDKKKCILLNLNFVCSGCLQCLERGFSCFFTDRMENKAFLTEKCKTEENSLVEGVAEMVGRATLLPSFQHKCSTVVASDLDVQVGEADRIGHTILSRFKYVHGNRNVILHNVYKCSSLVLLSGHNGEKEVLTLMVIELY